MTEKVKLNEITDIYLGVTHTPEYVLDGVPFLSVKDISGGKICFDECKFISQKEYNSLSEGAKPKVGDMLFCRVGTIGKPIIIPEGTPLFGSFVSLGYLRNKAKDRCNLNYLRYWMYSNSFWKQVNKNVKGASQVNLNTGWLSNFEIRLPDFSEQTYIVSILDKCKLIIERREEELKKFDNLIRARFVEMFGDPVSNSYGFVEATLPELGEFGRGVSKHRPRNDPSLLGGIYPLIQTGDVANSELYITSYNSTYSELGLKQSKMWGKGTLCITIAANIAKTAILGIDACFPDSIVGFNANEKTSNIFIHFWFSFFQEILESQAPESAQKNINLKVLSELRVIVPEKDRQDEFVEFINQVNKSKLLAALQPQIHIYKTLTLL